MTDNTTILIVDDMEINRVILKELFYQECRILEAENGEIALDLLHKNPETDIVIMDIVMPVMDGFEALHAIRNDPQFAGLPVVICTEHSDVDTQVRSLDLGSTDFITKPFNARVVIHRVRNLIEVRKMERKIAEQQRADQLRDILNSIVSPLGLLEFTGGEVRAIYLNQGFFEMFSAPPSELNFFFTNMLPALVPEDAQLLVELFQQNQEDGSPVDLIYRVVQKDGSISIHEMHALSIRYEHFENPVYLTSITDITNQRKTEVALRDTDQRLKSLINAIPGAILTFDLSTPMKVTYFNDTTCNMMNLTRPEFQSLAQDVASFVYPADLPMVTQIFNNFLQNPAPFSETFRIVPRGKEFLWVCLSGAPILTAEGTLLCNCVCLDVNAEKESELKLEQAFQEMQYRSEHDMLTGLLNRETFNQKTQSYLHDHLEEPHVFLAINIQRFKVINELFGAVIGDEVLRLLSRIAERVFGDIGICGRMEADHFMVCLPQAQLNMEQLMETFDSDLKMQYSDYRIELCFGIYEVGSASVSVDQMCDRATMALKTIKGSAVRRYAFYDDVMRKSLLEEQEIIEEMHDALADGQFIPYFQPIFNIDGLTIISAETLVRWKHPVKGIISPGIFVPLFESNGFITKLDFYIWEQACKHLHKWKAAGLAVVPLSINISRIDLYHPHLCEELLALLQKYDLDISLLKLEITESAYIDDPDALLSVLQRLHDAGFQILMDDFGSGYSSLNTLKDMPINIMKIDMCFLRQLEGSPRAASILTSVVRMAKWLDLPVVAEGLETKAQLDFLHSIGCGMGQGYFFSKPLPSAEFEKLLLQGDAAPAPRPAAPETSVDLDLLWNTSTEVNLLFDSMIGGMAVFEMVQGELKVQRANDAYCQIVGCTSQEVFHTSDIAFNYLKPADRQLLLDACYRALDSDQVESVMIHHDHIDQSACWLKYSIRHLNTAADYSSFFFIVNDVTPQRELDLAAKPLTPLEQEYQKIFFSDMLFVFDIDPKDRLHWLIYKDADAEKRFFPYSHYLNQDEDYIHPDDLLEIEKIFSKNPYQYLQGFAQDKSSIQVRLRDRQGGWVWAGIVLYRLDRPTPEQPQFLLCVKELTEQNPSESEWRVRAETDSMSLLYNRGAFQERVSRRLSEVSTGLHAFFLLDIDNFKQINDTLGHSAGDEVIRSVASALRQLFRVTDLVGRLGGDEFAVFMSYPADDAEGTVQKRAERILSSIRGITLPDYPELTLTVSLGVAIAPLNGARFEILYQKADKALYCIKSKGKNDYTLYRDPPSGEA